MYSIQASILKEQSQIIEIKQTNNQTTERYWKNKEFKRTASGKISAQPHTSLCIQFLNRENND